MEKSEFDGERAFAVTALVGGTGARGGGALNRRGGWENSLAFSFPEPPPAKRRHRLRLCLASLGKPGGMGLLGSPISSDVQAPMPPGQRA
jgi:hypothetical protein